MSDAHLRSGACAAKSRSSTLGATGWACEQSVVRALNRRRTIEQMPSCRITFATVFSHTSTPLALSSWYTRGLP